MLSEVFIYDWHSSVTIITLTNNLVSLTSSIQKQHGFENVDNLGNIWLKKMKPIVEKMHHVERMYFEISPKTDPWRHNNIKASSIISRFRVYVLWFFIWYGHSMKLGPVSFWGKKVYILKQRLCLRVNKLHCTTSS